LYCAAVFIDSMLATGLSARSAALLDAPAAPRLEQAIIERHRAPAIALLGIPFEPITLAGAVRRIEQMVASRQPHYVVTPNVDFLVQARRDAELHRILIDADLVVCDGTPLRWSSHLLGNALPERVAGADLVPRLIRVAARKNYRLFLLGATPEANVQAVTNLRAQFPCLNIAGHYSPPFRPLHKMDHENIAQRILAARPDLLLVAFGCPKAEKWIAMNYQSLGVPVTIGVGATIDFLAGRVKRAPVWMQRAGMEWLFRLYQEPRRLFRRYATDLWHFGWAMAVQWWHTQVSLRAAHLQQDEVGLIIGPTWHRIQLPKRLDAEVVRRGARIWAQAVNRHCLLDLDDVQFIDSTGVGLLLRLRNDVRAAGNRLILVSPSPAVRRTLRWMRLLDSFVTADDAVDARRTIEAELHDAARDSRCRSELGSSLVETSM
jgi:exopolysaccharide biosynthesis WecB/TagA/CpsF family protein/anti-anti-sigma factor